MTNEDFLFFTERIYQLAGIYMAETKRDLLTSRLDIFLRKSAIKTIEELKQGLLNADSEVEQQFVNLLTTNKTDFFREPKHFDYLIEVLIPLWKEQNKTEINIWCSASSTGEEAYTIAMVLSEHLPSTMSFKILATDIDTEVLHKAQNGVYDMQKISEIPDEYHSYLQEGQKTAQGWFKTNDELHSKILFKQHNLIESNTPGRQTFDLVFCRNVLIYFERETIMTLMQKMHGTLKSDGHLFIGHSETIQGSQHFFKIIKPAIFKKVA